jgi:CRISPR/Cas system-associated exonuclease Cas4 (RecB family)
MSNLSKSKYLTGMQCQKRLWLESHRRDLIPPISPAQERVFSQGHAVGIIARECFPNGLLLDEDPMQWASALEATKTALAAGTPVIFEPCFLAYNCIVRPDILVLRPDASFDVIEVKSTTRTKIEHVWDLAVQTYVLEASGLSVSRALLMHLNRACRYPVLIELFATDNLTRDVRKHIPEVGPNLATMKDGLAMPNEPSVRLGSHCFSPYECPFFGYCSKLWSLPTPSIFDIPHLGAEDKDDLAARGILSLDAIPNDEPLGPQGERFVRLYKSGSKEIDVPGIRTWLSSLHCPIYFLDFETDAPAIPRIEGLGPFGSIPFQFSLHILHEDGRLEEAPGFLHEDTTDPRPLIASALLDQIGPEGSLIAYNASFEKHVIGQLAVFLPLLAKSLQQLQERFADLLDVFRKYYIDPAFKGSNSIKAVLPVLCPDLSYSALEVGNGQDAQAAWARLISTPDPAEKTKLADALRAYCGLDTMAMVRLYRVLQELAI